MRFQTRYFIHGDVAVCRIYDSASLIVTNCFIQLTICTFFPLFNLNLPTLLGFTATLRFLCTVSMN